MCIELQFFARYIEVLSLEIILSLQAKKMNLLHKHPQEVVALLIETGIWRFYFVYNTDLGKVLSSHPQLQEVADFLTDDRRDFFAHEGLFFQIDRSYNTLLGAFVHKTVRGQGAGGTRFWSYETFEDYLRDGLRLAKGMTRKNALAGIWWGGGKGVIAKNPAIDNSDPNIRANIYQQQGRLITSIKGCYVTAEDAGTTVVDVANMFKTTRFTTCIPSELGGSGNPSIATARGIVCGMEAAWDWLHGKSLAGTSIAIQGVGNVGAPLIKDLFEKGVGRIIASDVNENMLKSCAADNAGQNLDTRLAQPDDLSILFEECDILSLCATGGMLNQHTIPKIKAKVVCGGANNQLEDTARDDLLLFERDIVYVPDFLTNRMGIVHCANEQYGYVAEDPAIERHLSMDWEHSIFQATQRVLDESKRTGQPPAKVAIAQADALSEVPHPIFGHRGQQIIDSLVQERWQNSIS